MPYSWTTVNPVASGYFTKTTQYNAVWDNIQAVVAGDRTLDQLALTKYSADLGTGNVNNYAIPAACSLWLPSATGNVTLSGITGGKEGRIIVLRNYSNFWIHLLHQSASSTAANRFSCMTTSAGQWLGIAGKLLLWYDTVISAWRVEVIDPGFPITPVFNAADYAASGSMTWTVASGNVTYTHFQQWGKTLEFWMQALTTSVGGTLTTSLSRVIPGGFAATKSQIGPIMRILDNGVEGRGFALVGGSSLITFWKDGVGNWTAASGTTSIYLPSFRFEVD